MKTFNNDFHELPKRKQRTGRMSMRLMNIQKDIWSHCTPHVLRVISFIANAETREDHLWILYR